MKPKHQRLIFIVASLAFIGMSVLFTMQAFRDNLVFFYTPSELPLHGSTTKTMRVGGLVEAGSVNYGTDNKVTFTLVDETAGIHVTYQGILPNLFRDKQGAVVEGHMLDGSNFEAKRVLTKHDAQYMPVEVVNQLKKTGLWYGEGWEEQLQPKDEKGNPIKPEDAKDAPSK